MTWKWPALHVGQAVAREKAQKLPMLAALGLRFLPLSLEGSVTELSYSPDWPKHSLHLRRTGLYTRELGCSPGPRPHFVARDRSLYLLLHCGWLLVKGGVSLP